MVFRPSCSTFSASSGDVWLGGFFEWLGIDQPSFTGLFTGSLPSVEVGPAHAQKRQVFAAWSVILAFCCTRNLLYTSRAPFFVIENIFFHQWNITKGVSQASTYPQSDLSACHVSSISFIRLWGNAASGTKSSAKSESKRSIKPTLCGSQQPFFQRICECKPISDYLFT